MTLPETMHGVRLLGHGWIDKLVYREDLPTPKCAKWAIAWRKA